MQFGGERARDFVAAQLGAWASKVYEPLDADELVGDVRFRIQSMGELVVVTAVSDG